MRSAQVARALQEFGKVKVVIVGAERPSGAQDAAEFDVAYELPVRPAPNRGLFKKLDWMLNPRSFQPHGMAADEQDLQRAVAAAGEHDLVWFFKLRTANLFRQWAWPRSVVDVDDVPSTFERSVLDNQRRPSERLATAARLWSWQRRERLLGERFSVITVCSEDDRAYLEALGVTTPVRVIANGYTRPETPPVRRLANPPRIGFIGVFDHQPNVEGLQWFARECWPRILQDVPDARLRLVGRFSDGPLAPTGTGIEALGWVRDPTDEIATWASTIVPVRVGAGTRGKIAHAFSQKCPVVSTGLGAYGYGARDAHNMFLAESAEDFADACVRTIRQPVLAAAVADRAWQEFLNRWTWDAIRPHVRAAAEDCLRS